MSTASTRISREEIHEDALAGMCAAAAAGNAREWDRHTRNLLASDPDAVMLGDALKHRRPGPPEGAMNDLVERVVIEGIHLRRNGEDMHAGYLQSQLNKAISRNESGVPYMPLFVETQDDDSADIAPGV